MSIANCCGFGAAVRQVAAAFAAWIDEDEVAARRCRCGGCNDRDGAFSRGRRYAHHALVYGFLLCVASTSAAAVYAYAFGRPAPYPPLSLPVILGTLGGVLMLVGTASLLAIKLAAIAPPWRRAYSAPTML